MKRKVIQLAGKTSVVSLPSKWVRKYNVCKGDELELEERGDELVIKTQKDVKGESFLLDGRDLNERTLRWVLSGLHKYGYDEIQVLYSKKGTLSTINDLIKNLFVGFAIIDQSSKKCSLRTISSDRESEFDAALRRAFLVTLSLSNASLEMVSSKDFKSLPNLMALEKTNNQLTNFCQRVLTKKAFSKDDLFKYVVIWNLEKVADDYKYICRDLADAKRINPELLKSFEEVNLLFKYYYELFYKFDLEKLKVVSEKKALLAKDLKKFKPLNEHERALINHLAGVVSKSADFSTSFFVLNHKSK